MDLLVLILVILALVCFGLEAFLVVRSRWNLVAAGLFCLTLALLLSDTALRV